ncbi:hypothetical protein DV735_g3965, partial [Chaetothyriales sp. CBS 134920]
MDFLKKAQKKMKELMDEKDGHGTATDPSHQSSVSDHAQHQQGSYSAPPPPQAGQASLPPLPPGWIAQWDQNSQRYFYVEQATGRTQWEAPVAAYGAHSGYGAPPSGYGAPPSGGMGTAVAAGAGGLAVGAIGGAILAHELNPSYGAPAADPYAASMPPPAPEETADGESVSSSDQEEIEERREELEEAQEEYNEAVEEAYDD